MASSCLFRANMSECPNFHHTSSPFHLYYGSPQKPVNVLSVQLSTSAMFMAQHALSFPPISTHILLLPHAPLQWVISWFRLLFSSSKISLSHKSLQTTLLSLLCFPISPCFLLSYFFTFHSLYYIQSLWLILYWSSLWSIKQVAQYLTQSKNTISLTEWMSYKVSSTGESFIPYMLSETADGFLINLILWVTII